MKKILFFLLLCATTIQAQTLQNPTYGTVTTKTAPTVTAPPTMATVETDGKIGKIAPVNIPINIAPQPTNYTIPDTKLGSHLKGIDVRLGEIGQPTAGVTNRIYFTGVPTTITAGTFYTSSATGKGAVAGVLQTVSNDDNVKNYFGQDVISIAQPSAVIAPPGNYTGQLSVMVDNNAAQERFTVEIYKTNNAGTPISSGITGAPVGNLGVTVVAILDSGVLDLVASSVSNVTVSGNLASTLSLATGERLRYHVSSQKVGTSGNAFIFSLFYGSDYNSYYDVPVTTTTDGVVNRSTVSGLTTTNALDALKDSLGLKVDKKNITIVGSGQSNMLGVHSGGDMSSDSRVKIWRTDTSSWQVADLSLPPFNGNNNLLFQFGKKYAEEYNVEVKLILNAGDWKPISYWISPAYSMWLDLTNQITSSGTSSVDIVLWHQGEADYSVSTVSQYADKFKTLVSKYRAENWFSETAPFIAGELLNVYPQQNAFFQNIRFNDWVTDQNVTVAKAADMTGDTVTPDPLHFSGQELVELGRVRYWNAFKSLSNTYEPVNKNIFKPLSYNGVAIGDKALSPNVWSSPLYVENTTSVVPFYTKRDGASFWMNEGYGNTNQSPHIETRKARGTSDSPLPVIASDYIGDFTMYGHDGNTFQKGSVFAARASSNWSSTNRGSTIEFQTVLDGSASNPLPRAGIGKNGEFLLYTTPVNNTGNDLLSWNSTSKAVEKTTPANIVTSEAIIAGLGYTPSNSANSVLITGDQSKTGKLSFVTTTSPTIDSGLVFDNNSSDITGQISGRNDSTGRLFNFLNTSTGTTGIIQEQGGGTGLDISAGQGGTSGTALKLRALSGHGAVKLLSVLNNTTEVSSISAEGVLTALNYIGKADLTAGSTAPTPTTSTEIANKQYVDNVLSGLVATSSSSASSRNLTLAFSIGSFNINKVYQSFRGTTATYTLPPVSGYTSKSLTIVNKGSGNITLNSNAGAADIWRTGSSLSTLTIAPATSITLYNDSDSWVVHN